MFPFEQIVTWRIEAFSPKDVKIHCPTFSKNWEKDYNDLAGKLIKENIPKTESKDYINSQKEI